jgi:uncharacterized protein (UPF0218 family)
MTMETTIQVKKKVRDLLEDLKIHPRESYNTVIERLIEIKTDEGSLSTETLKNIERALENVRQGKVFSTKQAKERLGIK